MTQTTSYLQAFASLVFVLGLIALLAWALRRFAHGNGIPNLLKKMDKRLTLVESLWLDARYRVVIVRDGAREHTLLLGPQSATPLHEDTNTSGLNDAK